MHSRAHRCQRNLADPLIQTRAARPDPSGVSKRVVSCRCCYYEKQPTLKNDITSYIQTKYICGVPYKDHHAIIVYNTLRAHVVLSTRVSLQACRSLPDHVCGATSELGLICLISEDKGTPRRYEFMEKVVGYKRYK